LLVGCTKGLVVATFATAQASATATAIADATTTAAAIADATTTTNIAMEG
jgi:hypothetical protein